MTYVTPISWRSQLYFNKIKVSFSSIVILYHMGHLANGSMAVCLAKQGVDRVSVTSGVQFLWPLVTLLLYLALLWAYLL